MVWSEGEALTPTNLNSEMTGRMALNLGAVSVLDYGVVGDGTTDDTAAIQLAENARAAARVGVLLFPSGRTYVLSAATGSTLLRTAAAGVWDFRGSTLRFGNASVMPNGTDNNAMGMVNVLHSIALEGGTIDAQGKVRWPVCINSSVSGVRFNCSIQSLLEDSFTPWVGFIGGVSKDISGVTVTSARANGIWGSIRRLDAPVVDNNSVVTTHADLTAVFVGGNSLGQNGTGSVLVGSTTQPFGILCTLPQIAGVPRSIFAGHANDFFGDLICHDATVNIAELNGTNQTNSNAFQSQGSDLISAIVKQGSFMAIANANLGTDTSAIDCMIGARGPGQAEIDFSYTSRAGGRILHQVVSNLSGATPTVASGRFFKLTQGSATTVTNFTSGKTGQEITVRAADANSTLSNGATLELFGAANFSMITNAAITLWYDGSVWHESSRRTQ